MANHIVLINKAEQRVAKVKVGFSWTLLFWTCLFALPLFIRRVYPWAFGIAALQLLAFILERQFSFVGIDYPFFTCETTNFCPLNLYTYHLIYKWSGLITFALSVYLGFRGNEITARYYLKNGYRFAEPDSALVALAKTKWHMQL